MAVGFRKSDNGYDNGLCPISVVELEGFSPDKIINIISYADDIHENSKYYQKVSDLTAEYTGSTLVGFPITYYEYDSDYSIDYLVSEKRNNNNDPLFYVYELKYDVNSITETDILQIYKNNETLIDPSNYVLEYGDTTLTNNYNGSNLAGLRRYGKDVTWGSFDSSKSVHRVRILIPLSFHNENDFYVVNYSKRAFGLDTPNHVELIELTSLYKQSTGSNDGDFYLDNDYIKLSTGSRIPSNTNILSVVRDPGSIIKTNGLFSLKSESYQNDAGTSWNLRINTGKFLTHADYDGNNKAFFSCQFVSGILPEEGRYQPVMFVKPEILGNNIFKVKETPIYIRTDKYTYPNYEIEVFPRETDNLIMPTGTIGIDINGRSVRDLGISSIDRNKGFILLNNTIESDDEVDLFFFTDTAGSMMLRNLELNPRVSALYGIHSNKTNYWSNIGIAVRKLPDGGLTPGYTDTEEERSYLYPYFFNFDDPSEGFYRGNPIPTNSAAPIVYGELRWNTYSTSNVSATGEFIPIAHLSVDKLSPDSITVTDARIFGGGLSKEFFPVISNNQRNSYVDVGYYDGEPLPSSSLLIIHIPRAKYDELVSKWENSNLFSPEMYTDILDDELEELKITASGQWEEYYDNLLDGRPAGRSTDSSYKEPYSQMLRKWARHEVGLYLDQMIKKYISSGSQYILLDENFNQIELEL